MKKKINMQPEKDVKFLKSLEIKPQIAHLYSYVKKTSFKKTKHFIEVQFTSPSNAPT